MRDVMQAKQENLPKAIQGLSLWVIILSASIAGFIRGYLTQIGRLPANNIGKLFSAVFVVLVYVAFIKMCRRFHWANSEKLGRFFENSFWVTCTIFFIWLAIWNLLHYFGGK